MKKRNVFLAIIFSVLTLGIYYIYWFVKLTNASNALAPKHATMGGLGAWLVSIITGGIYFFYWTYRLGQKAGEMLDRSSEGFLYLILAFFTFGFVPMCMGQSSVNKAIEIRDEQAMHNLEMRETQV